jgi:hypothetical protein
VNTRRVADLLRQLADAIEDEPANDAPPPKQKRTRGPVIRGPINPPTELDRARARDAARRLGHVVRTKP